ncbi:MAG TPA: terminase small subunit [Nocardioidaceae bacterium]|nr:terminase small subunit [Nocardioidaceae bacterium]
MTDRKPRRRGEALTPRQASFVAAYLENRGNATQAAIAAGYAPASAYVQGSRLLRHPDVAAALSLARESAADRIEATAERIVLELARIAFLDPGAMFDEAGELLPLHRMPADVRRAVASFDLEQRTDDLGRTTTTRKVRTTSKVDALRLLAQIRGLLVERVQHEGPQTVQVVIGVAPARPLTPGVTPEARLIGEGSTKASNPKGKDAPGVVPPGNDGRRGGES